MAAKQSKFNISALQFLCIDADTTMRQMLADVLRSLGVRSITEAADGKAGQEVLAASCPDIIFCEWELPEVNGIDLVRHIRGDPDSLNRMTPVIFVTAHTQVRHVTAARDAGVTEYLAKPFSARLIYSRICSVLEHPRAFIEAETFIGPDRRRRHDPYLVSQARRSSDATTPEVMSGTITDDEIEAMLGL
ncbi:response regulator [Novispirillum sp. DQ9]|uniref:response regulator n=1 Tax=Novispirillum sp. DQ9 TaxID=3398612 RepID=UPI003C79E018